MSRPKLIPVCPTQFCGGTQWVVFQYHEGMHRARPDLPIQCEKGEVKTIKCKNCNYYILHYHESKYAKENQNE